MTRFNNTLVCLTAAMCLCTAGMFVDVRSIRAAEAEAVLSAPEILPEGTILYVEVAPWKNWSADFSKTALAKIIAEPDIRAFCAGPFANLGKSLESLKNVLPKSTAPVAPATPQAPVDPNGLGAKSKEMADAFFSMMQQFAPGPYTAALRYSADDEIAKRAPAWGAILGFQDEKSVEAKNKNMLALIDNVVKDSKIEAITVTDYQGSKLLTVKPSAGGAGLSLVLHKNHVIATNDLEFAKQIMDGMAGTLARKLSQSAMFKSTGLTGSEHLSAYMDVAGMKKAMGAVETNGEGKLGEIFSLAGLDKADTVAWSLKMDGPAFASRTAILSKGERSGLMGALDAEALSDGALKMIPAGAPFAAGFRVKKDRIMPLLRGAFKAAQGDKGGENFDEAVKNLEVNGLGFDNELRDAFGGEFVIASLAGIETAGGSSVVPSFAASLSTTDPKKAGEAMTKLLKKMAEKISADGSALKEIDGLGIKYLSAPGTDKLGLAPAFAFLDGRLLFAFDVPSLKKVLKLAKDGGGLSSSERFKTALEGVGGKMGPMFTYVDYGYLFKTTYGFAATAMRVAAPADMLKSAGVDLNLLPDSETVTQHLFPAMSVAQINPAGMVLSSRSPLPSAEVLTPPMAAITAIYASFGPGKK